MDLPTAEFCTYDHHSPLAWQAANFCSSVVSIERLVTRTTPVYKPKFPELGVSTEFAVSVSTDFLLKVSRAIKLGQMLKRTQMI